MVSSTGKLRSASVWAVASSCLALTVVLLVVSGCGQTEASAPAGGPTPVVSASAGSTAVAAVSLGRWRPERLREALPGLLVARSGGHPRLEIVSPDGSRATTLWTPPRGFGFWLADCDPAQGRVLVQVWDRRAGLDEGALVLLSKDGEVTRLDLPGGDYAAGAVLLADGSILCNSVNQDDSSESRLEWSNGEEWHAVRSVGEILAEPGIAWLAPLPGRREVTVMTWAASAIVPATWDEGTLSVCGRPYRTDAPTDAVPLSVPGAILLPHSYAKDGRLAVDLVEVRWQDGEPKSRVVVRDGPQSAGHDTLPALGAGPQDGALVLGWRLDGDSEWAEKDAARLRHLQLLDLGTGELTVLPLTVRSGDGWRWLEP